MRRRGSEVGTRTLQRTENEWIGIFSFFSFFLIFLLSPVTN